METLNLGCGNRKIRKSEIGLDIKEPCDVLWDLNKHPLPFKDELFDEIYAYHVLEHFGTQGDFKFFFAEWNEYYRILKPSGIFSGIVPLQNSRWTWGDPGHTRVLPEGVLTFLSQAEYEKQVGETGMADYREWYNGNFKLINREFQENSFLKFVLQKI